MPFTAMSWRTPVFQFGGQPFVARMMSLLQASLPGFSGAGPLKGNIYESDSPHPIRTS
jgi:hypothetical protein